MYKTLLYYVVFFLYSTTVKIYYEIISLSVFISFYL